MLISQSRVSLYASHEQSTITSVNEHFNAWVDSPNDRTKHAPPDSEKIDRSNIRTIVDRVALSARSLELAHNKLASTGTSTIPTDDTLMSKLKRCATNECENDEGDDSFLLDARLGLMKQMVEVLTGRKIKVIDPNKMKEGAHDIEPNAGNRTRAAQAAEIRNDPIEAPQGWGVEYDYRETRVETEQTHFKASGVVQTRDGRAIIFDSALTMSSERIEISEFHLRAGDAQLIDPLVLGFDGTAAQLTDAKFNFDINSDGIDERISFVDSGHGFLVLDKNQDGIVNDGGELFGPTSGAGFAELALHDEDANGWIDEADGVYEALRIWTKSPDGIDSLSTLKQKDVGAIHLGSTSTPFSIRNANGDLLGQSKSTGIYLTESGAANTVQQIDLVG